MLATYLQISYTQFSHPKAVNGLDRAKFPRTRYRYWRNRTISNRFLGRCAASVAALALIVSACNILVAAGPKPDVSGIENARAGKEAFDQRDYDHAIIFFTRAIESGELSGHNLVTEYYGRGLAYAEERIYQNAISDFTAALNREPSDERLYYDRGTAYVANKQYDLGEQDLSRAIELKPDDERAYVNRSTIYYIREEYDRALKDLKKAVELNPNNPLAYNKIGVTYVARGTPLWSEYYFKKAIELKPDYQDAIRNLRKVCPTCHVPH